MAYELEAIVSPARQGERRAAPPHREPQRPGKDPRRSWRVGPIVALRDVPTTSAPSSATPSVIANATIVDFGTASANWLSGANLTKFRMFDAATAGNLVFEANLTIAKPVMNGDPVSFPIGALVVNLG